MSRRLLLLVPALLAGLLVAAPDASATTGSFTKHTLAAGATYPSRDYFRYEPATLPAAGTRTLVVMLHGCTQTAEEAAAGTRWNELADTEHFLVVYPNEKVPGPGEDPTDGSYAGCWNSGQGAVFERGSGEVASLATIAQQEATAYGVDPGRIFVAGISGGAMMASTLASVYPDVFAAVGHVANCGYVCADTTGTLAYQRMGSYARVVPVIDIEGSADDVTPLPLAEESVQQWLGTNDWADDGALNLSVPRVPTTVENVGTFSPNAGGELCLRDFPRNPCPGGVLGEYPVTVRTYAHAAGDVVVEAWTIHGLMHNWSGGSTAGTYTDPYGPNITPAIYRFFTEHAR
jgi:poly(hydroxyalkanoate) depolymerase family esterase